MQHAAGFILFEDVRAYATEQIDPELTPETRALVQKGIDDALYGLMMVADGVSGRLANSTDQVTLSMRVRHRRKKPKKEWSVLKEIDLFHGDGMCMGYHGWLENDYGKDQVVVKKKRK